MDFRHFLPVVVVVSLWASETLAKNQCPEKIASTQVAVGDFEDGWQSFGGTRNHPLVSVSFSVGSPDKNVVLAPSKEAAAGKSATAVWEFSESDEDYWVSCEYARTSVVIAKSLGKSVRRCTAEYDNRFSVPVVKKWGCSMAKE